jgi:hypothetical protein
MSAEQVIESRLPDLEQAIRDRIVQRTADRIRGLGVEATGDRIVISGRAATFHLKQLAIQGVFDVIGSRHKNQHVEIDVQIAVTPIVYTEIWTTG